MPRTQDLPRTRDLPRGLPFMSLIFLYVSGSSEDYLVVPYLDFGTVTEGEASSLRFFVVVVVSLFVF